jgi:alkanesulfonate monooxygenase SsuD/methylene tetrahydromethanopterin reductase-like flavin-dependent oxidoreductase (luciferase family)
VSDYTLKRVVEFCDGWFPIARPGFNPKKAVERLRQMASAAGRDFSTLSISVFGAPADKMVLTEYRDAGIQRAVLQIPDLTRDEIIGLLDKNAPLTA